MSGIVWLVPLSGVVAVIAAIALLTTLGLNSAVTEVRATNTTRAARSKGCALV